MLWKNSSVIKNLSQNVSLLHFLFLQKLISSDCLLQCRRSESASVTYLGHHYLSNLYRKPLSPSGLFVSDERSPNSGIQLSFDSILAAHFFFPRFYHWNPNAYFTFWRLTMPFLFTYQLSLPGLCSVRNQSCVSNMLLFTKTTQGSWVV